MYQAASRHRIDSAACRYLEARRIRVRAIIALIHRQLILLVRVVLQEVEASNLKLRDEICDLYQAA